MRNETKQKKRIFHSIGFGNRMIFNKPKKKVFEQKEPQNERTKTGKKIECICKSQSEMKFSRKNSNRNNSIIIIIESLKVLNHLFLFIFFTVFIPEIYFSIIIIRII